MPHRTHWRLGNHKGDKEAQTTHFCAAHRGTQVLAFKSMFGNWFNSIGAEFHLNFVAFGTVGYTRRARKA